MKTNVPLKNQIVYAIAFLWITTAKATTEISECSAEFLRNSNVINVTLNRHVDNEVLAHFNINNAEHNLRNIFKMKILSTYSLENGNAFFCIAFQDTTSYTETIGQHSQLLHSVFLQTNSNVFTGIISVHQKCFRGISQQSSCYGQFYFNSSLLSIPMYTYSPSKKEFWDQQTDQYAFAKGWIITMGICNFEDKTIPSSWITKIQISDLKYLKIFGNKWRNSTIHMGPLHSLTVLDISRNQISSLPIDFFENMSGLKKLILEENSITEFPKNLEILNNLEEINIANSIDKSELHISDEDVLTMRNVRVIEFQNVHLKINITSLLSLPKLTFANLSGCDIKSSENNVEQTEGHPRSLPLHILDLSRNSLNVIGNHLFPMFNRLTYLSYSRNTINDCISWNFKELSNLTFLDLSHNVITNITSLCFVGLFELQILNISWNEISYVSYDAFQHLGSITLIDLSNNKLVSLHFNTFHSLYSLRILDIANNLLISDLYLENLSLKLVNLSANNLTTLKTLTKYGTDIDVLDVSRNRISDWEISSVKEINLSYNGLVTLTPAMAKNFDNSKRVDLGGNPFNCCIKTIRSLKSWTRNTGTKIDNLGTSADLECYYPPENRMVNIRHVVYNEDICKGYEQTVEHVYENGDQNRSYLLIIIIESATIALMIIILIIVCIIYKKRMKVISLYGKDTCVNHSLSDPSELNNFEIRNASFEYDDVMNTR